MALPYRKHPLEYQLYISLFVRRNLIFRQFYPFAKTERPQWDAPEHTQISMRNKICLLLHIDILFVRRQDA